MAATALDSLLGRAVRTVVLRVGEEFVVCSASVEVLPFTAEEVIGKVSSLADALVVNSLVGGVLVENSLAADSLVDNSVVGDELVNTTVFVCSVVDDSVLTSVSGMNVVFVRATWLVSNLIVDVSSFVEVSSFTVPGKGGIATFGAVVESDMLLLLVSTIVVSGCNALVEVKDVELVVGCNFSIRSKKSGVLVVVVAVVVGAVVVEVVVLLVTRMETPFTDVVVANRVTVAVLVRLRMEVKVNSLSSETGVSEVLSICPSASPLLLFRM